MISANYAFQGCNINYWSKDLYDFGANGIALNGVFWCNQITAELDFLANMANKISKYNDCNNNGSACTYTFVTTSGASVSDVILKNVINLPNATYLSGFNNIECSSVDLTDCFTNARSLVTIYRFMGGCLK